MKKLIQMNIIISLIMVSSYLGITNLEAAPAVTQFTDSFASTYIRVAADNNNNAVAILSDGGMIRASYLTNGGPWGPLVDLSGPEFYRGPNVAMDATGTAIAMWKYEDFSNPPSEIHTAYLTGGVWTTPTPEPLFTDVSLGATSVAMNGLGLGLGAWSTDNGVSASFFSSGSWGPVTAIGFNYVGRTLIPSYSPSGQASVVWPHFDFDVHALHVSTYNGSIWSGDLILDTELTGDPDAGIDATGNTIVIWSTGIGVDDVVSSRFNGTVWSPPETLSVASGNTTSPSIAVDADGSAIAVWRDSGNNLQMIRFNGTVWGTPEIIASGLIGNESFAQPTITMNDNGDALIGWITSTGNIMNALLPKFGKLQPGVIISTVEIGFSTTSILNLALSSAYGFDVWDESNEFGNTFGSFNEFIIFLDDPDCYALKSATGEVLALESTLISQLKFSYNTNTYSAITNITGAGTITYDFGLAILQSLNLGSATVASKIRSYPSAGQGLSCIFAATFFNGDADTSEIAGLGNETDGFFFGSVGGTFGILYRNNSVDTFINQQDWNVDTMDGTGPSGIILDYTFGNVYKIQYQRLEFSNTNFYVESADTGHFILVHQIQYANSNTLPSLSNPGLQLWANVSSNGGNIDMELSSMGLFIEGNPDPFLGLRNTIRAESTSNSTNASFASIMNNPSYSSVTNQLMVFPDEISLLAGSESTQDAVFSLYLNPTLGGTPTYAQVNPNSCVSYSTESFPVINGTLIGRFVLSAGSSTAINIKEYGIELSPGDVMVIASFVLGAANSTLYSSISWLEQF